MEKKRLLILGILAEGARTTITASASPPHRNDQALAYKIDWGDGSSPDTGRTGPGVPFSLGHRYPDQGTYTMDLRVGDDSAEEESSLHLRTCVQPLSG